MSSNPGTQRTHRRLAWWLPCVLGVVAIGHAAGIGQAGAPRTGGDQRPAPTLPQYRVIQLGAGQLLAGPVINVRGQVAFTLDDSRGRFYDGATVRDIGTLGGTYTWAVDLNDKGQVTGFSEYDPANGFVHAFIWSRSGGMASLGALPGAHYSRGLAINNAAHVAGVSQFIGPATERVHAMLWTPREGMEDLGSLDGDSAAGAINDAGLVAGESGTPDGYDHAFAWTRGTGMIDLGTLGGRYSWVTGVGARGEVAGWSDLDPNALGPNHAYVWTRRGGMRDLGTAGGVESFPSAMSPNAHVVGSIGFANGMSHGFAWTRDTGMIDIGTLGGPFSSALGVNDNGQVVGTSISRRGDYHAFVWTAARGMSDLNDHLYNAPKSLKVLAADAISANGSIVATSNAGLVLLKPVSGGGGGPCAGPIMGADLVRAGARFDASVSFTSGPAVQSANWSWGDGTSTRAETVSERGGGGNAGATHVYDTPGIYTVTANLLDRSGSGATVSRDIVVYAPSGAVIGGSGSFMSPRDANRHGRARPGKAGFVFLAPAGPDKGSVGVRPQLRFNADGLSFRSENFSLAALEGSRARFEGSGTVNGARDEYRFSLATSVDVAGTNEPARFGLRIWHVDPATKKELVDYDNLGPAGAMAKLLDGSIALHQ